MVHFVGLDVHKQVVQAAIIDREGTLIHQSRFPCSHEDILRFAKEHLSGDDRLALEATTNTWAIVSILKPHVNIIVVSNPLRTKAIAQAKVKTDKVDALVLAQLLRCDYLPAVWIPDTQTQQLRHLTSRRAALVAERTAVKNRIHSVLHQRLIASPVDDLFCAKGLAWLRNLDLDELAAAARDSELRLLETIKKEIALLDETIAKKAYADPRSKLLMTLPGVNVAVAQTLLSALGDISRFPDPDHAASYLGLVPSTHQSAGHCYHGPITKQGNSHARWMMIQAAQHVARHPGPLGVFFRRLANKKNRNVAVVAAARKLVAIAYLMLSRNEPYRYAQPTATQGKLLKLRVQVTGLRHKTGPKKGSPSPLNHAPGKRTRLVPSLSQIYRSEGIPVATSLENLPQGERKSLRSAAVSSFVRSLQHSHRVERNALPTKGISE